MLAEGGNAVDACVAAAFAAWVAESPLTGPGAGGFALVRPGDGRPARLADFFVATPGRGRSVPDGGEMEAIDIGFGGDAEATQVFRIGGASCAVPGRDRRASRPCTSNTAACPGPSCSQPAIELARDGVELTRPQAHLHAILDLILRHTPEGRRLYSRTDGSRLQPGDMLALPDLGAHARADRRRGRSRRSTAASWRRRSPRRSRRGGGSLDRRRPRGVRGDLARAGAHDVPRPRGDLESAAVVGRRADRVRARAARPRRARRARDGRGARVADRGDARADARARRQLRRGSLRRRPRRAVARRRLGRGRSRANHRSRCPGRPSTRRTAARRTSRSSTRTATPPRSRRRPAPAPA